MQFDFALSFCVGSNKLLEFFVELDFYVDSRVLYVWFFSFSKTRRLMMIDDTNGQYGYSSEDFLEKWKPIRVVYFLFINQYYTVLLLFIHKNLT